MSDRAVPVVPASVPPCLRGESSGPSTLRSIATRLRRMGDGMGSPESVLRASQAAGYSIDEIDQIVSWYERQARTDGNGKTWWPYTLGQLATRLKDEQARLDGCTPAQGRWAGGKCGIWLSLAGEGKAGPGRAVGSGPDRGIVVPNKEQARRLDLREQARGMIRQRGINLLTKATQTPGEFQERAQKALQWINQGHWPETAFQTPQELWRLFEDILQQGKRSEVRGESQRETR